MFTVEEVGTMLDMKVNQVKKEINNGQLSYTFKDGEKYISLYDLEKYMGADQTRKITREFLQTQNWPFYMLR